MKYRRLGIGLVLMLLAIDTARAQPEIEMSSGDTRTNVLELYTSEGCSSCPPAEEWLAGLKSAPGLWRSFVPLQFHVDYWDGLGWPDRFASAANTGRQRQYAHEWGTGQVYTPGFVLNGRELRRPTLANLAPDGKRVGVLRVSRSHGRFVAEFRPTAGAGKFRLFGAVLASEISVKVGAGENRGETLKHNFVVTSIEQKPMEERDGIYHAELELETEPKLESTAVRHVAFWIADASSLSPIQAVAGEIPAFHSTHRPTRSTGR